MIGYEQVSRETQNLKPSNCAICLSPINQPALVTSCSHVFDLTCLLLAAQTTPAVKTCPICRAPMGIVLYDFNPSQRTCSALDINDATQYGRILTDLVRQTNVTSESEAELSQLTAVVDHLRRDFSSCTSVPLALGRTLVRNKPGNLTQMQIYRRTVYQEHLFPIKVLSRQAILEVSVLLFI
ncbi:hypothetical protein BLNAU_15515 [Blattamonas nauphoetae]|uniref:RING-type domain-containing protein n=1 Tax=Blattamonas nauphoetae TaxID=2049346 RepID=A0ABQ9XE14_9EUKA|nr:hypothetical protein BLNAU_15515 [Blattamonas nauphoetae]